jgi:hypothetical protein
VQNVSGVLASLFPGAISSNIKLLAVHTLTYLNINLPLKYLESIVQRIIFVREIKFENSMDDDPANIII